MSKRKSFFSLPVLLGLSLAAFLIPYAMVVGFPREWFPESWLQAFNDKSEPLVPSGGTPSPLTSATLPEKEQTGGAGSTKPPAEGVTSEAGVPEAALPPHATVVSGIYSGSSGMPVSSQVLTLGTAVGERPLWVDHDGRFAFVAHSDEFPIRIDTPRQQRLSDWTQKPEEGRVFVNLQKLSARRPRQLFKPDSIEVLHHAGGLRLRLRGSSELPVGERIYVRLSVAERVLSATSEITSDDASHLALLDLPGEAFFSGFYDLTLEWKRLTASAEVQQLLSSHLGDNAPAVIQEKHRVYVGRPSEERKQDQQILAFYNGAIDQALASRDLCLWVGSKTRKEEFTDNRPRLARIKRHPLFDEFKRLRSAATFDRDRWRELIDVELPKYWLPYRKPDTIPFEQKLPQLKTQLGSLYHMVFRLSRLESRMIYRALGKKPHGNDYVDIEHGLTGDYNLARRHLMSYVRAIKADLPRR